jgi:hypothetical protein
LAYESDPVEERKRISHKEGPGKIDLPGGFLELAHIDLLLALEFFGSPVDVSYFEQRKYEDN